MRTHLLRLAHDLRPHWRGLAIALLLMPLVAVLHTLTPWPMKLILDHVLVDRPLPHAAAWIGSLPGGGSARGTLGWLVAGTVVLFLSRQALAMGQAFLRAGVGHRIKNTVGARLLEHLQCCSLRFHSRRAAGDLTQRVTADSECLRDATMGVFVPGLTSTLTLGMMFAVMWRLDRSLSLLSLLVVPPLVLCIALLVRRMTARAYRQQKLEGEKMALAEQTLAALPLVQAFGREEYGDERFRAASRRSVRAGLGATVSQLQFTAGTGLVTALGTALVMVVGGLHVLEGSLSLGGLVVFLSYLSSMYEPLEGLTLSLATYANAAASAERVLEVLESGEEVREAPGARPLPAGGARPRGRVRLEAVTFGYVPGRAVLRGVSLEAGPGEILALVGPTGAGKSTLVSLILRFFDPWQGRVLFDGVDVREAQLRSLRAQVALVLQEPFLLPLSVAENIAYGRPGASREEVEAAAVAAQADEFIRRLPRGYQTEIGERGATLSGGERQRLAIARALLKDAPVLILDEPTAALDAETEAGVLEALERLMRGRTTFIIAHRLSTVRRADRIVVLEAGRIVEEGPPRELLAQRGRYHRLHSLQFAPAGPSLHETA